MLKRLKEYIKNSISELKKVSWPGRKDIYRNTLLVIVICLLMAIFLGLIDFLLSLGLQKIIR